jgi:hypothetical protein
VDQLVVAVDKKAEPVKFLSSEEFDRRAKLAFQQLLKDYPNLTREEALKMWEAAGG